MNQQNYLTKIMNKERILKIIPSIVFDKEKYYENILSTIRRDPTLFVLTQEKNSCLRLVIELERLARVGLTIGGIRPQAYILPFKNKNKELIPTTIPTVDGYKFIVTSGKNPVFKNIALHEIHENDKDMKLDEGKCIFENPITIKNINNRGKIIAYVFDGDLLNEKKVLKLITIETIEHNRKFSKSDHIWKNHYKRMCEKTALKHILRDFIYVCEGLANMDDIDNQFNEEKKSCKEKVKLIDADTFVVTEKKIEDEEQLNLQNNEKSIDELL